MPGSFYPEITMVNYIGVQNIGTERDESTHAIYAALTKIFSL